MKKIIAILFLSLICLTTIPGKLLAWNMGYELATDSEEPEKENKEGKKEVKEFTVSVHKPYSAPDLICNYKAHKAIIFPQPVIDKQTPPPNTAF
jgi:hypothetical protein